MTVLLALLINTCKCVITSVSAFSLYIHVSGSSRFYTCTMVTVLLIYIHLRLRVSVRSGLYTCTSVTVLLIYIHSIYNSKHIITSDYHISDSGSALFIVPSREEQDVKLCSLKTSGKTRKNPSSCF